MEMLRTRAARKLYRSYAQNPPLAKSNAAALTSMFIKVSFLEIELCWTLGIVCQSPGGEFLLTMVATLSSSELKVRPAFRTAARLTSQRTLFPSRTNWIMPPCWENSGMSLTVRTACLFRALMIVLSWASSAELRKRIWQLPDSCGVEIRLAATLFPAIVSPASVVSRNGPKGSWPRIQTVKESFCADATFAGHSTKWPKL